MKNRILTGVGQVADFWVEADGGKEIFISFITDNFIANTNELDTAFTRYNFLFEKLDGHMLEIMRNFRLQTDLDIGDVLPLDEITAAYNPAAHLNDDFFENKIAFIVLLNFPLKTLEEKLADGENWSRKKWAEVRLAERFSKRIPSSVMKELSEASAIAEIYIASYNIFMNSVLSEKGEQLFPKGMKLLSHWNLRDEIKALYQNTTNGLEKQKIVYRVMERIIDQSIPKAVINNPNYLWNPFTNEVKVNPEQDNNFPLITDISEISKPEPDTRYQTLLRTFTSSKLVDDYSPTANTHILRRFNEDREIPEDRVKSMFVEMLTDPVLKDIAKLIEKKLGRKLQPFDIWFNGFKSQPKISYEEINKIVRAKYPTPEAYEKDIPNMLRFLGFNPERSDIIASRIKVDAARGSGHAMGASMKSAYAYLRTRISDEGMDYKGFNIAMHELGHNVEQTISLYDIDYYFLNGVPNTAFTEAYAFTFQAQDLKYLDMDVADNQAEALELINDYWQTIEIAAVSLVDIEVWHWMYNNPNATSEELKKSVISIAKNTWNKYLYPVFGIKDATLLGVYSHMIHSFLYLPDYPLGHIIAFQIKDMMKKAGSIGPEFERTARLGRLAPDLWMKQATGNIVTTKPFIEATKSAIKNIK